LRLVKEEKPIRFQRLVHRLGNRIGAKKEGNLFRSPNRNCEKL